MSQLNGGGIRALSGKKHALSPSDLRFLSIGVVSAILFFIGERTDAHMITFIFKPLPIYCMIIWTQYKAKTSTLYRRLIQIGLFFGSMGDIFLCLNYDDAFNHGLGSFLVGHLFYAYAFRSSSKNRGILHEIRHSLPYLLWCIAILVHLKVHGDVGALFIPLAAYTAMLFIICWFASLYSSERTAPPHIIGAPKKLWHQYAPVIGAVLFTTSDMMIALDKFLPSFYSTSTARMIYMGLYYIGQLAIAYSTLEA